MAIERLVTVDARREEALRKHPAYEGCIKEFRQEVFLANCAQGISLIPTPISEYKRRAIEKAVERIVPRIVSSLPQFDLSNPPSEIDREMLEGPWAKVLAISDSGYKVYVSREGQEVRYVARRE